MVENEVSFSCLQVLELPSLASGVNKREVSNLFVANGIASQMSVGYQPRIHTRQVGFILIFHGSFCIACIVSLGSCHYSCNKKAVACHGTRLRYVACSHLLERADAVSSSTYSLLPLFNYNQGNIVISIHYSIIHVYIKCC